MVKNDNIVFEFREDMLAEFWDFITERHTIWRRRIIDKKVFPWTKDPILRKYHFCNVYRELDKGTIYPIKNILEAPGMDFRVKLFNLLIYRLFNWPATSDEIGLIVDPEKFNYGHAIHRLIIRQLAGKRVFSNAYLGSGAGLDGGGKIKPYLLSMRDFALDSGWDGWKTVAGAVLITDSMEKAWYLIQTVKWFGKFIAYQVVLDLMIYNNRKGWTKWIDTDRWFLVGGGAKPGLEYMLKDIDKKFKRPPKRKQDGTVAPRKKGFYADVVYVAAIRKLTEMSVTELRKRKSEWLPYRVLNVHDIEFCCCEFRKYINLRRMEAGGPRRKIRYYESK